MHSTHGGNRDKIARQLNVSPDELIDFSANINPLGFPSEMWDVLLSAMGDIEYYPNPEYPDLTHAIAEHFGVKMTDVFVGNGSMDLIFAGAMAVKATHALVLAPTFGEYERALTRMGTQVVHYQLDRQQQYQLDMTDLIATLTAHPDIELVCLGNPNNPTGQRLSVADVQRLVTFCNDHQVWLFLDEAFMDLSDDEQTSFVPQMTADDRVLVIRSATKFFAVPGLRLGFALTRQPDLQTKLAEQLAPWSVNVLAARFGEYMYQAKGYRQQTAAWFQEEQPWLYHQLEQLSFIDVLPSTTNFFLFRSQIPNLREKLYRYGIMIRQCDDYVGLTTDDYRVAVRTRQDNQLLIEALLRVSLADQEEAPE